MTTLAERRHAFSLIELLCVLLLIAVLGVLLAVLLRSTLDVERAQSAGFSKSMQASILADEFRADVNRAENTLPEWQDYQGSVRTLILRTKTGHVIYTAEDGRLHRRAFEGANISSREIPVGGAQVQVEFLRPGPNARTVRLRLHAMARDEPMAGHSLEIAAALGGDWR
jgi:prepilin-type N-terminal cleavage/methylation domain-containing protein